MDDLGYVTPKKNHSINISIIGKGNSMSTIEHFFAFFSKSQYIARNQRKTRDQLYVSTGNYTSDHGGQEGRDGIHDKINVNDYAYQKLFVKATKKYHIYSIDMKPIIML